uniref:Hydrophobic seed protein domain-containing protein n=1 Tax=Chenopodium quinoa TaxID=63459 RepID=A0A803L376_CHEQI
MASRSTALLLALFLALNLVLLDLVFATFKERPLKACPPDTLELDACTDVLYLVHLHIESTQKKLCCNIVGNLIKLDAATCLCTAVNANILVLINLDINVELAALVNYCDHKLPSGFQCPPHHGFVTPVASLDAQLF